MSLLDNLVLQLSSSIGCMIEGRVVIFDRFIWSTYVKYKALGYPVGAISGLYLLPKPTFALVLDVPVEKSLRVIYERVAHIHYPSEVLRSVLSLRWPTMSAELRVSHSTTLTARSPISIKR